MRRAGLRLTISGEILRESSLRTSSSTIADAVDEDLTCRRTGASYKRGRRSIGGSRKGEVKEGSKHIDAYEDPRAWFLRERYKNLDEDADENDDLWGPRLYLYTFTTRLLRSGVLPKAQ